jgi:hypothetical protein
MDNERKIICRTIFGSKLYGTDTPESDTDYKSVFMPSEMEILTGKIPKTINMTTGQNNSRNGANDVDHESFSLHYFMELLYQGQTVALDMLHGSMETITTPLWRELKSRKRDFYTKNMRAFVGYARKQASKYGIKGGRLDAAREALAFLMSQGDRTIGFLYETNGLWENEHTYLKVHRELNGRPNAQVSFWEVCGKKMTFGGKASYYVAMLKKFYDNYGGRAILAAENKGIDWKAVSHAFRVAYQTKAILQGYGFCYPLQSTAIIRAIKSGEMDYKTSVAPALDDLMEEIEALAKVSTLPESVDTDVWEKWLADSTSDYLNFNREAFREI